MSSTILIMFVTCWLASSKCFAVRSIGLFLESTRLFVPNYDTVARRRVVATLHYSVIHGTRREYR